VIPRAFAFAFVLAAPGHLLWVTRSRERRRCTAAGIAAAHRGSPRDVLSTEHKESQAFQQELRDAGYSEGRDAVIEWRSANGEYNQVSRLVADLVQRKVDVIVADSTVGAGAAKQATSTIPIVMATIADPVGSGLVASLAHPGETSPDSR
jgi:hypothetical protein